MKKNIYLTILLIVTVICVVAGSVWNIGYGRTWRLLPDTYENKGRRIEIIEKERGDESSGRAEQVRSEVTTENDGSGSATTADGQAADEGSIDGETKEIESVVIRMNLGDIHILTGGDVPDVSFEGKEAYRPEVTSEQGVLKITQPSVNNAWGLRSLHAELTVTLPEWMQLKELAVKENLGDIDVNGLRSEEITIQNHLGDINLEGCQADRMVIESDMGDVDVKDAAFGYLEISQHMGDVDIDAAQGREDTTLRLETDLGEVCVNGVEQGRKYIREGSGEQTVIVDNNMGDIDVVLSTASEKSILDSADAL